MNRRRDLGMDKEQTKEKRDLGREYGMKWRRDGEAH